MVVQRFNLFAGDRQNRVQPGLSLSVVLSGGWTFSERRWQLVVRQSPYVWTLRGLGTGAHFPYNVIQEHPMKRREIRSHLMAPQRSAPARGLLRAACTALTVTVSAALLAPSVALALELGSDVQTLLDHARSQSPELAAMRHEAEAVTQRLQPAGALPDPVLRVELENFNNYGSNLAPNLLPARVGDTKYTLLQSFPAWGKRDLRRDVVAAEVQQVAARANAVWVELAARIQMSYAQYYLAAGTERLTREVLDLITRLEQIALARYAGGLAPQQDALRAQLEQTALRSELITLDAEKQQLRARINALLGRDGAAALAEPQALRALPADSLLDAAALAPRVRSTNPLWLAERARLLGSEKNRDLTLRNRYPDFSVGLSSMQVGTRLTSWTLMVELNIPLQQTTRDSQEREAEAMVSAAQARSEVLSNQLMGDLGENLAGINAARRREGLITNQQLPQSEVALRSSLAAYENGKLDFATLLEAQRQIRKTRQDQLKAQVEVRLRLADIERILGDAL